MSLTVVFIIAQGKIEKNFTILFWFQSGRSFFLKYLQLKKAIIKPPQI